MKLRIKSLLSLCIVLLMTFSKSPLAMAMDEYKKQDENSAYVLTYYDIATGTETMLTATDAKIKFGIDVDTDTLAINAEPKKPTDKLIEKKLTEIEKKEVEKANARGIKQFNEENKLVPTSKQNSNGQTTDMNIARSDPETRTVVSNTNQFPYYCTAKIYSGNAWIGTGFSVGKNLLATARHCVQTSNGWKSSVTAYFGFNNGSYFYKADNAVGFIYSNTEMTTNLDDWAFVVWGTNTVNYVGAFGMNGAGYTGMPVSTMGYPQDLDSGNRMYECSGIITNCRDYDFNCNLRVYNGQSGSPVYQQTTSGPYAVGIITNSYFVNNGQNDAIARRIDSSLVSFLIENGYA